MKAIITAAFTSLLITTQVMALTQSKPMTIAHSYVGVDVEGDPCSLLLIENGKTEDGLKAFLALSNFSSTRIRVTNPLKVANNQVTADLNVLTGYVGDEYNNEQLTISTDAKSGEPTALVFKNSRYNVLPGRSPSVNTCSSLHRK